MGSSSRDIRLIDDAAVNNGKKDKDGNDNPGRRTTPFVDGSRADDGSVFTEGQTHRVDLSVRSTELTRVRDRLPEGWEVVEDDAHEIIEEDGERYVVFEAPVRDDTLTYLVEAPSEPTTTGSYAFGPAEYQIRDGEWITAPGTEETNSVAGPSTSI